MKRSRFTQEQIIGVLKEHQAGATAPDLSRKGGISESLSPQRRQGFPEVSSLNTAIALACHFHSCLIRQISNDSQTGS